MDAEERTNPTFQEVLDALLDMSRPFPPNYLYMLCDLSREEEEQLAAVWPRVEVSRRRGLMEDMEALTDDDMVVSFKEVGLLALQDPDPAVRFGAVRLLWVEEDNSLIPRFLELARHDADVSVRANAIGALGGYMYLAALEELPWHYTHDIETALLAMLEDEEEDDLVRRQALEVLGYSLNVDIDPWIEEAFRHPEEEWQASALFAAGRTARTHWAEHVMGYLHHISPRLRAEAARAAGEMVLSEAVDDLLELLQDATAEVRMMAAWALSEIGGGEAIAEALTGAREDAVDDEEAQVMQDALDNLAFTDGMGELLMMDFSPEDLEDMLTEEEVDDLLQMFGDEDAEA